MHRLPIRSVLAARCALRCAPMAARSLRHLISDTTLGGYAEKPPLAQKHQERTRVPIRSQRTAPALCCPAALPRWQPALRSRPAVGRPPRPFGYCGLATSHRCVYGAVSSIV
ncbi:hypothetical protein Veis_3061 [Verminephrobacter eiseniae EF01-2]|uniref:Uncharacterized protein n=1 Tax=Verminephrobacter eiseniae (strain EF01-2) TaxID=391735 RepID=A1WMD7_VEREI|nr:hypothetical protein Veis_3061 [Verminephrobacter eiseniae EF01-2]